MKEQYVGDINDYRKYALLRALSARGANRIGVCWMLTPSDGSTDGSKLAYLSWPDKHRHFDPELFDILANAAAQPDRRRLQTIEDSGAIPSARYFNAPLSDNAEERRAYMSDCVAAFADVDLVFFDPDNGLDVPSVKIGRKKSSKYVYLDEVRALYEGGKSILIYQHFPFKKRDAFVASCVGRLNTIGPDAVIGTFRTADVVFLLLVHPRSHRRIVDAAREAASRWDPKFIAGILFEPAGEIAPAAVDQAEAAKSLTDASPSVSEPLPGSPPEELPPSDDGQSEAEPRSPSLLRRIIARLQ